jgi:hypothetical protein
MLILGDLSIRNTLGTVQTLYGDGTFDRCPLQSSKGYVKKKFAQCYVLLVERVGMDTDGLSRRVVIPLVHVLLAGKDEDTYRRMFRQVKRVRIII